MRAILSSIIYRKPFGVCIDISTLLNASIEYVILPTISLSSSAIIRSNLKRVRSLQRCVSAPKSSIQLLTSLYSSYLIAKVLSVFFDAFGACFID
jgi:hypothetical protein